MTCIPSLSQFQLEILRLAKKYSGKAIHLSFETPIIENGEPPIRYPSLLQQLIDCGYIEVKIKRIRRETSRFQRDSWADFCSGLALPSIRAWELWRQKFIATQEGLPQVLLPGEGFEDFSDAWVQEIRLRAVQPSSKD
ncbi:MAG: hypothetical protein HC851_15810 [Acaryochloris sp. RU_4_1]|nr:hypothetical protein [Acaryochloris sp. RU_4_1]NJR57134.1 hypothetical protein [Acaryochloris sp. CRU_2_0]